MEHSERDFYLGVVHRTDVDYSCCNKIIIFQIVIYFISWQGMAWHRMNRNRSQQAQALFVTYFIFRSN